MDLKPNTSTFSFKKLKISEQLHVKAAISTGTDTVCMVGKSRNCE